MSISLFTTQAYEGLHVTKVRFFQIVQHFAPSQAPKIPWSQRGDKVAALATHSKSPIDKTWERCKVVINSASGSEFFFTAFILIEIKFRTRKSRTQSSETSCRQPDVTWPRPSNRWITWQKIQHTLRSVKNRDDRRTNAFRAVNHKAPYMIKKYEILQLLTFNL